MEGVLYCDVCMTYTRRMQWAHWRRINACFLFAQVHLDAQLEEARYDRRYKIYG